VYASILQNCEAKCLLKPRQKTQFRKEARDEIIRTAIAHNDTAGKWILCPFAEKADEIWEKITYATTLRDLTHHAKIATTNMDKPPAVYPICIYVTDFSDKEEVKRVLSKLQELGIARRYGQDPSFDRMPASFKPDVLTRLGCYHRGVGGVRLDPILYRIDDL